MSSSSELLSNDAMFASGIGGCPGASEPRRRKLPVVVATRPSVLVLCIAMSLLGGPACLSTWTARIRIDGSFRQLDSEFESSAFQRPQYPDQAPHSDAI
jgi:hypothetical protein